MCTGITCCIHTSVYLYYLLYTYQCVPVLPAVYIPVCTCITCCIHTSVYLYYLLYTYQCVPVLPAVYIPVCTCITCCIHTSVYLYCLLYTYQCVPVLPAVYIPVCTCITCCTYVCVLDLPQHPSPQSHCSGTEVTHLLLASTAVHCWWVNEQEHVMFLTFCCCDVCVMCHKTLLSSSLTMLD